MDTLKAINIAINVRRGFAFKWEDRLGEVDDALLKLKRTNSPYYKDYYKDYENHLIDLLFFDNHGNQVVEDEIVEQFLT